MTNPSDLVSAVVTKLKAIAALTTALGSANYIVAYEDEFPTTNSLWDAIEKLSRPRIMVAWTGTAQGRRGWEHRLSLYIKAPGKYTTIIAAIFNGVPAGGDGLNFRNTPIHASCYPIFGGISAQRQSIPLHPDFPPLDYVECPLTLIENGPNQ